MIWMVKGTDAPKQVSLTEEKFLQSALPKTGWKLANLEDHRSYQYKVVNDALTLALTQGKLTLQCIPGFEVDVRRGGRNNDVENLDGQALLVDSGLVTEPIVWVGTSERRIVSREDLSNMKLEMTIYGGKVYQHKFILDYFIANASSIEELQAITWDTNTGM